MPSDGDMGNSEVGHNAMGAGRIFDQGAKLVGARPSHPKRLDVAHVAQGRARATAGGTIHMLGLVK